MRFTAPSPWTWVGHRVSVHNYVLHTPISDSLSLRLRFFHLNLARNHDSPVHSARGTPSPINGLRQLVGTWFQELFHSLPGCFSLPPHGTGSLSVTREYLALRDGPRGFRRGFTCPAVLRILNGENQVSSTGLSPSLVWLPSHFDYLISW